MKASSSRGSLVREDSDRPPTPVALLLFAVVIAFCLSLVAVAGATSARLGSMLGPRLSGQVTILVWGRGLESADAAAARAAELLALQAGVRRAAVLEPDESDAIVGELAVGQPSGMEAPRLVMLSAPPGEIPPTASLRRLLNANGLAAIVDDHRGGEGPLETRAMDIALFGVVLGLGLCFALFVAGWAGGSSGAITGSPRFELMIRLGADAGFVGAWVGRRLGIVALVGGVVGVLFADLLVFAAVFDRELWSGLGAPAFFQPQLHDGVWTAALPLVVGGTAAMGGGLGARRAIIRREREI